MIRKILICILILLVLWLFLRVNNSWIQTTKYTIESDEIPKTFDGLKIVQISDLQDGTFGEKQSRLLKKVRKLEPDLVVITGDLVDSNRYDLANSLDLIKQLVNMTDVFFVLGNHEVAVNQVDEITERLAALGVIVLRNQAVHLKREGEVVSILGVDDPLMKGTQSPEKAMEEMLQEALSEIPQDRYTILLSHRPELMDAYVENGMNLVFSGHAHGGQIRLPGLGGLIAPGQGWFPRYTSGKHHEKETTMIISRGLGNSLFPFRIFNRPEIIVATLKASE